MADARGGKSPKSTRGRLYRGADLDERRQERRAKLLAAGLERIGTVGYRAATVRGICAEAGLTERYFYESFANGEALLAAVYEEAVAVLRAAITEGIASSEQGLSTMARGGLEAFFAELEADPRLARVVFFEILGVSDSVDALYRRTTVGFATMLADVGRSAEAARASEATYELRAIGLVGAVVNIGVHWALSGFSVPRALIVDAAHEIFETMTARARR